MEDNAKGSSECLAAIYEVDGPESRARATADRLCFDQTIETEKDHVPPSLESAILGHLEELRPSCDGGTKQPSTLYGLLPRLSGADITIYLSGIRF